MFCRYYFLHVYINIYIYVYPYIYIYIREKKKLNQRCIYYLSITCLCLCQGISSSSVCVPLPVLLNDSSLKDVLSGFAAGATGTAMNCWTDAPTLGPVVSIRRLISGSLDSPVAGFRTLDLKNFPLHRCLDSSITCPSFF